MTKHAQEEGAGGRKRRDASDKIKIREELQKHTNRIFAEPEDRLSNIMEQLHPRNERRKYPRHWPSVGIPIHGKLT